MDEDKESTSNETSYHKKSANQAVAGLERGVRNRKEEMAIKETQGVGDNNMSNAIDMDDP